MNEFYFNEGLGSKERKGIRQGIGMGVEENKENGRDKLRICGRMAKMKRLGVYGLGVVKHGEREPGKSF